MKRFKRILASFLCAGLLLAGSVQPSMATGEDAPAPDTGVTINVYNWG